MSIHKTVFFATALAAALVSVPTARASAAPKKMTVRELVVEKQCFECHKPNNSLNAPRLHGMSKKYIMDQLASFRAGKRTNVFMRGMVEKLSDLQIEKIAEYFSRFDHCMVDMPRIAAGFGNPDKGRAKTAACAACHIPNSPMNAPMLDGQNPYYMLTQLQALKSGKRENPLMVGQLNAFNDQDLADIADYYASLDGCGGKKAGKAPPIAEKEVTWNLPENIVNDLEVAARARGWTPNDVVRKALAEYLRGQSGNAQ